MDDLSDLTSFVRKTRGVGAPPPLIGSSTTVIGDALYVFGGRSADAPAAISAALYRLDLGTFAWRRCPDGPTQLEPRYFHSANAFGDKLVVFGGQTSAQGSRIDAPCVSSPLHSGGDHRRTEAALMPEPTAAEPRDLAETVEKPPITLASVAVYDTRTEQWSFPECECGTGVTTAPTGRYGHLAAITRTTIDMAPGYTPEAKLSRLTIIGGQNANNVPEYSLVVLDLDSMQWIDEAKFPRRVGSYRAAATSSLVTIEPMSQNLIKTVDEQGTMQFSGSVHSSIARPSDEEQPEPIVVFSNTNFSDPRREIDLVAAPVDQLSNPPFISVRNREVAASGPPGLRFPSTHMCGHHMIVTGVHIDHAGTRLAIWSLDLGPAGASGARSNSDPLRWEQINSHILKAGSWNSAVLHNDLLILLGSKEGNAAHDYAHRRCNFQHIAIIDLEAFGIYEPPRQLLSYSDQSFGLLVLYQSSLDDFAVISRDGERIACSRMLLTTRWPWLKAELAKLDKRTSELEMGSDTERHSNGSDIFDPIQRGRAHSRKSEVPPPSQPDSIAFPLTEDSLRLPFDSPTTRALLQFFFTLSLSTPLQRSISTLNTLLWIVKTYPVFPPSLERLTVHALHESLSQNTAAKVFEAASLAGAAALRSRAARMMVKASAPAMSEYHSACRSSSGHYDGSVNAPSSRPRSIDSLPSKPRTSNGGQRDRSLSFRSDPTVDIPLVSELRQFAFGHHPNSHHSSNEARSISSHSHSSLVFPMIPGPPRKASLPPASPYAPPAIPLPSPPEPLSSFSNRLEAQDELSRLNQRPLPRLRATSRRPATAPTAPAAAPPTFGSSGGVGTPFAFARPNINQAWLEGERRDQKQRIEAARLQDEARASSKSSTPVASSRPWTAVTPQSVPPPHWLFQSSPARTSPKPRTSDPPLDPAPLRPLSSDEGSSFRSGEDIYSPPISRLRSRFQRFFSSSASSSSSLSKPSPPSVSPNRGRIKIPGVEAVKGTSSLGFSQRWLRKTASEVRIRSPTLEVVAGYGASGRPTSPTPSSSSASIQRGPTNGVGSQYTFAAPTRKKIAGQKGNERIDATGAYSYGASSPPRGMNLDGKGSDRDAAAKAHVPRKRPSPVLSFA